MNAAIAAAGGRSKLAALLDMPRQNLKWRTCPQEHLLAVASVTGLSPADIRPDLAEWARIEQSRRLLERARARFGSTQLAEFKTAKIRTPSEPAQQTVEIFDMGVLIAALRFAAAERGFPVKALWEADRHGQAAQSARAYGLALAAVAGRVSSTLVAAVIGCSRQNVDNAARRYERARDGDVDEEVSADGVVIVERGRRSKAREPNEALWAAERRFLETLGAL